MNSIVIIISYTEVVISEAKYSQTFMWIVANPVFENSLRIFYVSFGTFLEESINQAVLEDCIAFVAECHVAVP